MKARKVGAAAGESTTTSSIPSPQPAASPVVQSPSQTSSSPVQQITKQIAEVEISIPRQPCLFQGKYNAQLVYYFPNKLLKSKLEVNKVLKPGLSLQILNHLNVSIMQLNFL